eukprot:m.240252 g.240252  ORF g.240252 m.240252 type:complete len:454 (-) comp15822_c0_seq4:2502-3863(-)
MPVTMFKAVGSGVMLSCRGAGFPVRMAASRQQLRDPRNSTRGVARHHANQKAQPRGTCTKRLCELRGRRHLSSNHVRLIPGTIAEVTGDASANHGASCIRGLVAGLLHSELGITYTQAFELLASVPSSDLEEALEAWAKQDTTIVYCTERHTVMDTVVDVRLQMDVSSAPLSPSEVATAGQNPYVTLRSLHFNENLDLVQSCGIVDPDTGAPAHGPPPLWGPTGTAVQGLSLGIPYRAASLTVRNGSERAPAVVAVLGAGACTLPVHIHAIFPQTHVVAVELDSGVAEIARAYYGVADIERSSRFQLRGECAFDWIDQQPPRSVDILIIDMQFGGTHAGLLAPPPAVLLPTTLTKARALLREGGVIAINTVGTRKAVLRAAREVAATALCWVPQPTPGSNERAAPRPQTEHVILFCGGEQISGATMMSVLKDLPPLVNSPQAWFDLWCCPIEC